MAGVTAAVAEEGLIAAEAPVDVAERAERFRGVIDGEGPAAVWVLEDRGRIVSRRGRGTRDQRRSIAWNGDRP
jgi:hypothetical protein